MKYPELKWDVFERSVESYRSVNIASQSFLLAVGALLSTRSSYVFYPLTGVALIMIWYIWVRITISRQLIADYHRIAMELDSTTLQEFESKCSQDQYVHDTQKRSEANKYGSFITNWRPTRLKVDFLLPSLFTLIWLALFAEQVYREFIKKFAY